MSGVESFETDSKEYLHRRKMEKDNDLKPDQEGR